jgi:hypothetical protein
MNDIEYLKIENFLKHRNALNAEICNFICTCISIQLACFPGVMTDVCEVQKHDYLGSV